MPTGVYDRKNDLVGQRFGRLVVLRNLPSEKFKRKSGRNDARAYVEVQCDCGSVPRQIRKEGLKSGNTTSCGCLQKERARVARWVEDRESLGFNILYRRYKKGAESRRISWELSEDDFRILTKSRCWYTGRLPTSICKDDRYPETAYTYNGIDRVDNDKGYTLDNCVPCCMDVNLAKRTLSLKAFLLLVKDINDFRRLRE